MKKLITLIGIAFATSINAQVMLSESFTAPWTPTTTGWTATNVSVPVNASLPQGWYQGVSSVFNAYSGAPTDYYAADYTLGTGASDLNAWLITPTLNLTNNATLKFATRSGINATNLFPDRLQVRYSIGTGTAVGTSTAAPGTFTNLILDINPAYTTNTISAVTGGSVNGYPDQWTVYTLTLSSITGTVPGRFAFRYLVQNGGPGGANSYYIGLDDVQYSLPCATPTISISPTVATICSGNSIALFGSGATTYTWSSGVNTASALVSPSVTTVYALNGSSTPGCITTKTVQVNVNPSPVLFAPSYTICALGTATLVASGASTYTWSTGSNSPSITVSPLLPNTYTVTGSNGTCATTKTVSVSIGTALSINLSATQTSLCTGNSTTISALGATAYTWLPSGSGTSSSFTPTSNTTYTVSGTSGSCSGSNTIAILVSPTPTLSVGYTPSNSVCTTQGTVNLTALGATTYTWFNTSGGAYSNNATVNTPIPSTPGTYTFNFSGSNSGCTSNYTGNIYVIVCTGLNKTNISENVKIYPNPFANELTINGISGQVNIYNSIGQLVNSSLIDGETKINTSEFSSGIYYIKIKDTVNQKEETLKMIKE
ncbi:MAG: choice-of-anchor J domain-containing protein [Bacteroidota bacterium]|nr:choice-of-anchor J domain-containing protein [Bacteroidota bacterium]